MNVVGKDVARRIRAHPTEAPKPAEAEAPRQDFWVVDGGLDLAARVARFLGTTLLITFIVGLVGALVLHATIIESQRDLDAQKAEIVRIHTETEEMRHELAELEAPARIVAAAKKLGMIEAPSIVYLNVPAGLLDARTIAVAENQLRTAG